MEKMKFFKGHFASDNGSFVLKMPFNRYNRRKQE